MKQILIIYRNNDLFNTIIPEIISQFPEEIRVNTLIFPQGTSAEEIEKQREEKLSSVTYPTLLVSDNTCKLTKKTTAYAKATENGLMRMGETLDVLLEKEIWKISNTNSYGDTFKKIASIIISKPSNILMVQDNLKDHISDEKIWETAPATIEGYLNELYPNAKIEKVQSAKEALSIGGDDGEALIIADRHTHILNECWTISEWPHKAKLFMLPFENAIRHLGTKSEFDECINVADIALEILNYYDQI